MKTRPASSNNARCEKVIRASADPERARHGFEQLRAATMGSALATIAEEHARILAALFSGSHALGALLLQHPEWATSLLLPENLAYPRQQQGLRREVQAWFPAGGKNPDFADNLARLRQFKQRELLRIATRDLARLSHAPQITRELSDLADICLQTTLELCRRQLTARLGTPYHQDAEGNWHLTAFAVLGLGKLGGQELNYSSDVDVILVYTEEGSALRERPGRKTKTDGVLSSHQFFKRLAEAFIAEITRSTADGFLYRIDLRLRPEGETGPLVRSFASYESYYAQWGQFWERMMLIKARGVAGDTALAAEFLEMLQPFRYPRSLGEGALREIAAMKSRIENEVIRAGELERNVKLGRGGIREIEFIVQTAQVLHGGRMPFLQGAQTLPALEKLAQYNLLTADEAKTLAGAYAFLRDVEHRLQMENNLQTHTIPTDPPAVARLGRLMGYRQPAAFASARKEHSRQVRALYEKLVHDDGPEESSPFPRQIQGAEAEWKTILAAHGFQDVERSLRLLHEFAHGPGYVHVSRRTTDLAMQLLPRLFHLCRHLHAAAAKSASPTEKRAAAGWRRAGRTAARSGAETAAETAAAGDRGEKPPILSDPDRVLARLDSFITAYGARALMFETWTANPQLFELLLRLFDRSEFLAELAIRTPDLVDELVLSGRVERSKTAEEILQDLRHGRDDSDQRVWMRRYHQAEFLRIGLRGILGLADHEQNFLELTALADACLCYAVEVAARQLKLRASPVAIIGLGKLGGQELTYGSDLDILFVADDHGKKELPRLQALAVSVLDLLSTPTDVGIVFVTDARLRPDGEKGLLVNTLEAYREYYLQRAQLWEIQAITRVRPIGGNRAVGERFREMAASMTNFKVAAERNPASPPTPPRRRRGPSNIELPRGYTPDWKREIGKMRARIEKERTPPGQDALAFKTGSGGLIDAEFIAQTLCLAQGWQEPNSWRALQRARDQGVLPPAPADRLLANYRRLRRMEAILRCWSFEGEDILPTEPAPYLRVALRCGFDSAESFRQALATWRQAIREVYRTIFPA